MKLRYLLCLKNQPTTTWSYTGQVLMFPYSKLLDSMRCEHQTDCQFQRCWRYLTRYNKPTNYCNTIVHWLSDNAFLIVSLIVCDAGTMQIVYLRRPVEQVCCPRTRTPHQWRNPRWARIFLRRSMSSRSLASTFWANTWLYFPVLKSFCLFKNQSGILNWRGFWMIATSFSISSAESSPALLLTSISAFLQIRSVNRRPRPLIFVKPKTTFLFPATLVFRIRRMCWNSAPCINDVDLWTSRETRRRGRKSQTTKKYIHAGNEAEKTMSC